MDDAASLTALFSWKCPFHVFVAGAVTATVVVAGSQFVVSRAVKSLRSSSPPDVQQALAALRIPPALCDASQCVYADEILHATVVGLQAGEQLKSAIDRPDKQVDNKGDIDFVTATDRANEKLIFSYLKQKFPSHCFIGEESSSEAGGTPPLTDAPTWIIDPIDGTTNFVHRFPFTCVSIGFTVGGQSVMGVVFDPMRDELFIAAKGCGAFLNGHRIAVSGAQAVKDSIVVTEYGYQRTPHLVDTMTSKTGALLKAGVHSIRILGSMVLDLCYIAAGRMDGLYIGVAGEGGHPWDHCAASIILTEAGGVLTTVEGTEFYLYSKSVVAASSSKLAAEIVQLIN